MSRRPTLLMYSQHSLGMGHLVRSLALAEGLDQRFHIVIASGGSIPPSVRIPEGVEVVQLPPLSMDAEGRLRTEDKGATVAEVLAQRSGILTRLFEARAPEVVVVELFPFGRKKFEGELRPLLAAATASKPRPVVACSIRDLLVNGKAGQESKDAWSLDLANEYFDLILVHSDPSFARFSESFSRAHALKPHVVHTGFVVPEARDDDRPAIRERRVLVSAGGGVVGEPLFDACLEAQPALWREDGLAMRIVAGPLLPDAAWARLQARGGLPGLDIVRSVRDLAHDLRRSAVSVSQCGYNTSLEILATRTPSLFVPFGDESENEQRTRASRLVAAGLGHALLPSEVSTQALLREIRSLVGREVPPMPFSTDGAANASRILSEWSASRRSVEREAAAR